MEYKVYNQMNFFISTPHFDFRSAWYEALGGKDTKIQSHCFVEIYIVKEGSCILEMGKNMYLLKKGTFAIIPAFAEHKITNLTDNFKRVLLGIDEINKKIPELYKHIEHHLSKNNNLYTISNNMMHCLNFISDYIENEYENYSTAIEFMLSAMFYEIFNIIGISFNTHSKNRYSEDHIKLTMAVDFIRKNVSSKITSQTVARHVNLSVRQLNRLMLKHRGHTVKHIIDGSKINNAALLLTNTKYSLSEIALKLGFSSEHSFIVFFKRLQGVTPNQYRKNPKY